MATFIPLRPRIGAEAQVTREEMLDPAFAGSCLAALEKHGVLLFPQVHLTDEQQVEFSSHLGKVIPQGPKRADGTREIVFKITLDQKENNAAEYLKSTVHWHIDGLFDETPPPRATLLSGRRLSPTGGQTEFCNVYAAYEDLSEADRRACDSLRIMHSLEASNRVWNPGASEEERTRWRNHRKPKEHPLVWKHASGRKSLVLGMTVDYVVGMPAAGSAALVERLTAHTTRPENVYRHEWSVGDLLIWDNCGVMHRALPYDPTSGRMMHRTVLDGIEAIT
ncbi:MAG TPA: TauD/TfdA family dioxygenase [Povalibacter sp.]|uniref:TauD/TfdA dioxygenase family protein n=1 Tax=Povalibacter sp. TaxID=1962978 RepID=UPI002C7944CB|nr:TauD/TfdA family dioxygenase [Povalibacter sp.]HMN43671.1 TauD/TfdA family dioxygenase [Povalibacter sp.]